MDKRIMFAVAGAGKTTYIIENLNKIKKSLIVTYTTANYNNLHKKISDKFKGEWPANITLTTYFSFLYGFCYKPFLSDKYNAKGIIYKQNPNPRVNSDCIDYYMSKNGYLYSNRLAYLLERAEVIEDIKLRIEKYFDEFIIDEIQDIGGRDFSFLECLMASDINMLFVGDFHQHTFDTSRDGNKNGTLFKDKNAYIKRFTDKGIICDTTTLVKSWRCSHSTCDYIKNSIGIEIYSNHPETDITDIIFVSDTETINRILQDENIIKLHYQNASKYGSGHKNWGETKGDDSYTDVCVMLNKTTAKKFAENKLNELPTSTMNKLYVAITRAKRKVYFINE